jgi:hypothetical protein
MRGQPDIHIKRPLKENKGYLGMKQEGKSSLMCYHLKHSMVPYTLWDEIGAVSKKLQPLNPRTQKIIDPTRVYPIFPSHTTAQRMAIREQRLELFRRTCHQVLEECNQMFIVDEVHHHCTKRTIDPDLANVITDGGNSDNGDHENGGVSFIFTSQEPRQLHNTILGENKHYFIFKLWMKADLDWLGTFIPESTLAQSQTLPSHAYIYCPIGGKAQLFKPLSKLDLASLGR